MACVGILPSCCGENPPDPKSGWDFDAVKLGCATSCWGDKTDPTFLCFFSGFEVLTSDFSNRSKSHRVGYRVNSSGTPPLLNDDSLPLT